jgi:aryl-alcohol dehydrogenase-like predicted oxidoreductase
MTISSPTHNLSKRFKNIVYTQLEGTELTVSEIGFGSYRIDAETPEHKEALKKSLLSGINLIDTSSNYTDGSAEKLIGTVLTELIEENKVTRKEIVLISKVGYIQGRQYERSQQRKLQGIPYQDVVFVSEGLEHCIHPQFLEDQLEQSLNRLNTEYLDVYLLHNPEYFLMVSESQGMDLLTAREIFYDRIKKAFVYLEDQVKKGRISYYGVSSNTLPHDPSSYQFVSLETLYEIANEISSECHFKVIQCPLNFAESGAVTCDNNAQLSVLDFSKNHKLSVFVNRPYNGFVKNALFRFVDYLVEDEVASIEVEDAVQELVLLEETQETLPFDTLIDSPSEEEAFRKHLNIASLLSQYWSSFKGFEHWLDVLNYSFLPQIESVMMYISSKDMSEQTHEWFHSYFSLINHVMRLITAHYKAYAATRSGFVKQRLLTLSSEWGDSYSLSHYSLFSLRQTLGVTAVLVGMRKEDYVTDALVTFTRKISKKDNRDFWREITQFVNTI